MAYTVSDGTTTLDVLDLDILESTNNLDQCAFMTTSKYSDNTALVVYDGATPIFYGYQKKAENRDDYDVMYNITLMEKAVEMQYVILRDSGNPAFTKTDTADNLIAFAVAAVNTAYGYSGGDAWTIDSGSSSSTSLTIGCYYTNAMAFIRKVVVDNLGYKLWFDSSTKKVYFGEYFVDRTATPIDYIKKKEIRDSNQRGCTKVTVIGSDSSVYGSSGSGNIERIFEYPSATTSTECGNLAARILSDVSVTNVQWEVVLGEGVTANVGDYIDLDGSDYIVNQKETTLDEVTITVGSTETSILETLGTSITEITGETVTGSDASWSGGNTNVAANAASYTNFTFDIKDINMVSNAFLDCTIGSFIKSADVSANTNYLSAVTPLLGSVVHTANENISSGSSNYYPYNGSVRYVSKTGMTDGFQYGLLNFTATVIYQYDSTSQYIRLYPQYSFNGSTWNNITDGGTTYYIDIYLPRRKTRSYGSTSVLTGASLYESRDSGNRYVASTSGGSPTTVEYGIVNDVSLSTSSTSVDGVTDDSVYVPISFTCLLPGTSGYTALYARVLIYNYTDSTVTVMNSAGLLQVVQRHTHPVVTTYDKSTTGTPPSTVTINVNSNGDNTLTPGTPIDITSWLVTGKNTIAIKTPASAGNQCSVNPTITYQTLGRS